MSIVQFRMTFLDYTLIRRVIEKAGPFPQSLTQPIWTYAETDPFEGRAKNIMVTCFSLLLQHLPTNQSEFSTAHGRNLP